jgi:RNA polymerase sigma factor (sigma-70 family)
LEQELISNARKGDKKSLEKLYKHFYGYALGVAMRYCSSKEEACEVVNDSFMKAFDKLHTYQEQNSFKGWLRRVIINTSIDAYRKSNKFSSMMDIETAHAESFSPEILDNLGVEDILVALNQLPNVLRMVFNLYEIEGFAHNEIAEKLNIPASSSRTYLVRAKQKLREKINELNQVKNERASIR